MAKKEEKEVPSNTGLETQKYLYETGLQNIFNDYQKEIASLDVQKQKQVEDAYYVTELSKKYLGGYASNTGVGDVSGQLLDIYGKYQQNLGEIDKNYNQLEQAYTDKYQQKKEQYNFGLAQTQSQIMEQQAQKQQQDKLAEIQYNLTTGVLPQGQSMESYLGSVRDVLGESNYWDLMGKNKLVSMNKVAEQALSEAGDYKSQSEFDYYIDNLYNRGKINQQQSEYLKGMYETEQNTNFTLDLKKEINANDLEMPKNIGKMIQKDANVFVSKNKKNVLVETKNIVNIDSGIYGDLEEKSEKIPVNTPFEYNGKFFVKDIRNNEIVFIEYAGLPNKKAGKRIKYDWSYVRPSAR